MLVTVSHNVLGEITYNESFWAGQKELYLGKTPLAKQSRNTFLLPFGENGSCVTLKGNYDTGVTLFWGDEKICLVPSPKWYEILLSIWAPILVIIWGNSVALCSILPMIGGALGGAVAGISLVGGRALILRAKRVEHKVLIGLGISLATILVSYLLAIIMIGILL